MTKYRLERYSNIEFPLRNLEITVAAIKQAILPRKEKKKYFLKHRIVTHKTHIKTSIQAENCLQTYTLVVNKLERTHFQEVLSTVHIKLFLSLPPSPIFTTASRTKMDFSHPHTISFISNGLLYPKKYFHFSVIDSYVGLECHVLIFHCFDDKSPRVALCCGKNLSVIFSILEIALLSNCHSVWWPPPPQVHFARTNMSKVLLLQTLTLGLPLIIALE